MGKRVGAAVVVALVLVGCTGSATLDKLLDEPILAAPPGATLLAEAERKGSAHGFGTNAGVIRVWGFDGSVAEAREYYTAGRGDFDIGVDGDRLSGIRGGLGQDYSPAVTVRIAESVDDIRWSTLFIDRESLPASAADAHTIIVLSLSATP